MSSCARTCGRWCGGLRDSGVTIILTTHYIEEAEEMADRIGVINKGELILVEDKDRADAQARQEAIDAAAARAARRRARRRSPAYSLALAADGNELVYTYDTQGERTGITAPARSDSAEAGIALQGSATPRKARSRTSSSIW